jgi:predicted hydrocarbon binding protein
MARAKGTTFLHDREFIVLNFGPAGWALVLAELSPAERETLESVVAVGWYDHALQARFLGAAERALGDRAPKLMESLGRYAAEADLKRIHRVFLRMANPAMVLEKAAQLWGRYFDTGTWTIRRVDHGADAILAGAGVVDELWCKNLCAYLQRLFELVGARDVTLRHPECRAHGGAHCAFVIRWR